MEHNGDGYIEIILGNMFSGKTSEILKRYRKFIQLHRKCLIIKYLNDTRYSKTGVATHDLIVQEKDVINSGKKLFEVYDACKSVDVVIIDEGQFFIDIPEFAEKLANEQKVVIIAGLDGDFRREKFGRLLELIPKAEKVKKLHGICGICRTRNAYFSKLIKTPSNSGKSESIENIGGSEKYIGVCRKCYFKETQ